MATDDGGPAFPTTDHLARRLPGMTLRDWFAGQALPGLPQLPWDEGDDIANRIARKAYVIADAMLAERAKGLVEPAIKWPWNPPSRQPVCRHGAGVCYVLAETRDGGRVSRAYRSRRDASWHNGMGDSNIDVVRWCYRRDDVESSL